MTNYRTKLEAYEAGYNEGYNEGCGDVEEEYQRGVKAGIAQEKARAKKKLNPYYNRKLSLKERVDREAEVETKHYIDFIGDGAKSWQGLGKTKQPSLWERVKGIINISKYRP